MAALAEVPYIDIEALLNAPPILVPDTPFVAVPLTHDLRMKIDLDMLDTANGYTWYAQTNASKAKPSRLYYAVTNACDASTGKQIKLRFHHLLLPMRAGYDVDHTNQNSLDNRRVNLRYVPRWINRVNAPRNRNNTSMRAGVCWRSDMGRWAAYINPARRGVRLGYFDTPDEAGNARDEALRVAIAAYYAGVDPLAAVWQYRKERCNVHRCRYGR